MWVKELRGELKKLGDATRAAQMRAYMKSALPYYGVPLPEARKLFRQLGKRLAFDDFGLFETSVRYVVGEPKRPEERDELQDGPDPGRREAVSDEL